MVELKGHAHEPVAIIMHQIGLGNDHAEQRGDLLCGLIEQTAKVPWDDRRADARVEDIRESKVREYLRDLNSGLLEAEDPRDIYRRMRITSRANDHEVPRNAALLFFTNDPERWIRGGRIEVVQFAANRAGNVQEERKFTGSLIDQIVDCQNYLENLSTYHLQKQRDRQRVRGWVSYPLATLRETLVNAVYHRGYDIDSPNLPRCTCSRAGSKSPAILARCRASSRTTSFLVRNHRQYLRATVGSASSSRSFA